MPTDINQNQPTLTQEYATGAPTPMGVEASKQSLMDFKVAKPRLEKIISDWDEITQETERARIVRYVKVDRESLKKVGLFKEDETYCAVRLIDTNIRQEQPQYVAYLTQARRAAVIRPKDGSQVVNVEKLEEQFTCVARYLGWEKPFIRVVDGAATHGWDFVEVVYDSAAPGNFVIEHISHNKLMFDRDAEDIQNQQIVIRWIERSAIQLEEDVAKFGFSREGVDKILGANDKSEQGERDVLYDIYKCIYRELDGLLYVAWYSKVHDDWIKEPQPLFMGRRDLSQQAVPSLDPVSQQPEQPPLPETEYPFYMLAYIESENPKICDLKGRAFLDEPAQEASSGILSGIVNGTMRASNLFASPPAQGFINADSAAPKQTELKIKHGLYFDRPINFFNLPYPPPEAIQSLGIITSYNKGETSKIDVAVQNRKDSRKTATEVSAAQSEAAQLGGVQVTILSTFIREVYSRCFAIYQNRVLQHKIIVMQELLPLFQQEYEILSSGDTDVIKRQEKAQKQMQAWGVIASTPLAIEFLKDIIRTMFPEESTRYIAILDQGDVGKQLVMGLSQMLLEAITDETGKIKPEYAEHTAALQQLQQRVQAYLNPTPQEGGEQPAQNDTQQAP